MARAAAWPILTAESASIQEYFLRGRAAFGAFFGNRTKREGRRPPGAHR